MLDDSIFEALFDAIPFGIYVVDVNYREVVYVNQAFKQAIEHKPGLKCWQQIYQQDQPCLFCKIPELVNGSGKPNGKVVVFEYFNDTNDCWYQLQESAMVWHDGRVVKYSISVDISQLKEVQNSLAEAHAELALKNRELEKLANLDRLTSLNNRLKLDEIHLQEVQRAERFNHPCSIMLLDLDNFKEVNDQYGHQMGDSVLINIAGLLKANLRKVDTVGRWGGEEFLIICPETSTQQCVFLAEKLRQALENYNHGTAQCTGSFGITGYIPGDRPETMVRRADNALYLAKHAGRNCVRVIDSNNLIPLREIPG
ncbi:sensor domain-containing diguanylate cyclase [Zooshikella harenae]|uniref:diguanylate cyclase n=1 Tax=Zooshikella harenae TaxID=2827238 RepID=A0ABS5ZEE4_9GAMM|nr:diguanylate cyclase [Zooshikella harenae]MBU2711327.1 diguanylate cyclase [Zooshikella harenae]